MANKPGTESRPMPVTKFRRQEIADAKRMFELRTGEDKMTLSAIADEMGCSVFRVQKLLNKWTPKIMEKDASKHREAEISKLDILEEKLWDMIDEEYYTVSHGKIVYFETGEPVMDIDPVLKIIDRLLKVQERRAKLLGLDKPVRVEATVHQVDKIDMELAEMLRQGRAEGNDRSRPAG